MTQEEPKQDDEIVLKISAKRDAGYVKRVAGAMTWRLQEKGFFKARAVKQDAVNTAIKAIAICNQRVALADITLYIQLFLKEASTNDGKAGTAIEMLVQETDTARPAKFVEYKVSGKDEKNGPQKLAEAIAGPVRAENGVTMKCIGPAAVYRAIMASTMARGLIYPNGLDAIVVPSWDTITKAEDKVISLIKLDFWSKKIV